jgi:uncharacterized UPF0160 family protein
MHCSCSCVTFVFIVCTAARAEATRHCENPVCFDLQAVNEPGSFALRKGLPSAWRGLRGAELHAASGVPGGVFVHAAGFIGGHDSENGALQMAVKGLEQD